MTLKYLLTISPVDFEPTAESPASHKDDDPQVKLEAAYKFIQDLLRANQSKDKELEKQATTIRDIQHEINGLNQFAEGKAEDHEESVGQLYAVIECLGREYDSLEEQVEDLQEELEYIKKEASEKLEQTEDEYCDRIDARRVELNEVMASEEAVRKELERVKGFWYAMQYAGYVADPAEDW